MRNAAWLFWVVVLLAAPAALGEEAPPGGAERVLSPADLTGVHGERAGEWVSLGGPPGAIEVPRVLVGALSPPGRVPVLFISFDGVHPLRAQLSRAVAGIERCGNRDELVLTVGRCLGGIGRRREAAVRRKAESVARALRSRGFRTEVTWGGVTTFCRALPAKHRDRVHPVEVIVERLR